MGMLVKFNAVFAGMVKVADALALGCEIEVAVIDAVWELPTIAAGAV